MYTQHMWLYTKLLFTGFLSILKKLQYIYLKNVICLLEYLQRIYEIQMLLFYYFINSMWSLLLWEHEYIFILRWHFGNLKVLLEKSLRNWDHIWSEYNDRMYNTT